MNDGDEIKKALKDEILRLGSALEAWVKIGDDVQAVFREETGVINDKSIPVLVRDLFQRLKSVDTPKLKIPGDEVIERMCAAHWNHSASRKWHEIPAEWKPFYREAMRAALAFGP